MNGTSWLEAHLALILCIAGCTVVTLLSKLLPVTFLKGDNLPVVLRHWLSFVPVAVMAALVGPDIFIYEGHFSISPSNLFLMAGLPTLLVAWWFKNYFLTIAVGIGLVILARYTGLY
ncbi:AzlD domain-containing protein [Desulfovibrio sp. 86]|uniref:Branched-chain amino acid transport n=1 Tax=uncultured Desulfovibrio sp. TaxID=167968 RepID=A0A212L888_9BACT|nr:AzlD domain-containing protein [Desulfovibrio sp. 86]SCM73771.1 Branched-chain amino acid transport [uncultured Desulfovibrio sp.]VZH34410.1 Branched-chain amino acid transport [Desulfovibrio sp. 86]